MGKGVKKAKFTPHAWFRLVAVLVFVQCIESNFHKGPFHKARRTCTAEKFTFRTSSEPFVAFVTPVRARRRTGAGSSFQNKRINIVTSSRDGERRRSFVCRSLFFRQDPRRKKAKWRVPEAALVDLGSGEAHFPYQIHLEYDGEVAFVEGRENITSKTLMVRHLEVEDLATVVPMCVKEFGSGETAEIWDFPWDDLNWPNVKAWWDRLTFARLLQLSIRLKIKRRKDGENPFNVLAKPDENLVCLADEDEIVGIIELSLQPPDPERNPPPFPVPMWVKQLICKQKGIPPPEGWITNLLVDEQHRRLGYGKVLCCAVEGLARSWGCNYIYLHTMADTVSGAAPQTLYRSLNYEPVLDQHAEKQYSWMGPELLSLGLYIVEGVPLLFLRKQLNVR